MLERYSNWLFFLYSLEWRGTRIIEQAAIFGAESEIFQIRLNHNHTKDYPMEIMKIFDVPKQDFQDGHVKCLIYLSSNLR